LFLLLEPSSVIAIEGGEGAEALGDLRQDFEDPIDLFGSGVPRETEADRSVEDAVG
jgi:hypothetical protein